MPRNYLDSIMNASDPIYNAILAGRISEIPSISNDLLVVELTPDSFSDLKAFFIVDAARHLYRRQQFMEAQTVIERFLKINLNKHDLFELLNQSPFKGNHQAVLGHFHLPKTAEDWAIYALIQGACCKDYDSSVVNFQQAIELNLENNDWYLFTGFQFIHLGDRASAEKCFQKCLEVNPKDHVAWTVMVGVIPRQSDLMIEYIQRAINLCPDYTFAKMELAFQYFYLNQFDLGWKEYESRLDSYDILGTIYRLFDENKRWRGESLDGKVIVVFCEQGLGDYIQFVRYVLVLKQRYNVTVVLQVFPELKELFKNIGDQLFVIDPSQMPEIPQYDYFASCMSLPFLLDLPLLNNQYLSTNKKIDLGFSDYFKIGICWSGNPLNANDGMRSVHLKHFKVLADIPGIKLFSLQKTQSDYGNIDDEDMDIIDLGIYFEDFNDTAAAVNALDLVISVETSVLPLAGALNTTEVWGLIPFLTDWRWGNFDSTLWFNSMKLFRQNKPHDWNSVFETIKDVLLEKLKVANIGVTTQET